MLNLGIIITILLIQIIPSIMIDYLSNNVAWNLYIISMLTIILLQALIIYRLQPSLMTPIKILTLILMVVSGYFLLDYSVNMMMSIEGQVNIGLHEIRNGTQ